jgi:hypothetical protein
MVSDSVSVYIDAGGSKNVAREFKYFRFFFPSWQIPLLLALNHVVYHQAKGLFILRFGIRVQ